MTKLFKETSVNLYYKVLTFFYKLFYKALQFPTRNSLSMCNNKLVITYMNEYSIRDIQLLDDGLYHGRCFYKNKNTVYSLQGATLDLLVQDLIEGIEDIKDIEDSIQSLETIDNEGTTSWNDVKKELNL